MDPKDIGRKIGQELLQELAHIKEDMAPDVQEGDKVLFEMSGEERVGTVEHVMLDGYYAQPGSKFRFQATLKDPAVLIRIWDGEEETELLTGRRYSEIRRVEYMEDLAEESAEKYAIPQSVRNNAKRGLELRKKFGRGGTDVGMNTARTLAAGGSIGIEKVRHISRYFPRHANDNLDDKTSNGWIAWLLWGGSSGWRWSRGIVNRVDGKQD